MSGNPPRRIFLAGATSVVGRRLTPLLTRAGHAVAGTTRSADKAAALRAQNVDPIVVDVFDADALARVVAAHRPDVVIHQLTDLPKDLDPRLMTAAIGRNARIRDEGTRNLVAAALAAGVPRIVAQSIAWAYAPGPEPHGEGDPLDADAQGDRRTTVRGVIALEAAVLSTPGIEGVVLRYGQLYGPGAHSPVPSKASPLHVDAAAHAALLAIDRGRGTYNIAQSNAHVATDKARVELGWSADFRLPD